MGSPGGPGASGTNPYSGTYGFGGGDGYDAAAGGVNYTFDDVVATGGAGGALVGTDLGTSYTAGEGGFGVAVEFVGSTTQALFNSGTYTGGSGGTVSGTGKYLFGGGGGDGIFVSASALVNGGTFQGGSTGTASGVTSPSGGLGVVADANGARIGSGVLTINDGTFIGGSNSIVAGSGLYDDHGTANIFGGTFTAGTSQSALYPSSSEGYDLGLAGGVVNLYGYSFIVNGVPTGSESIVGSSGTISARLQNNANQTSFTFDDNDYESPGTINLIVVPEPTMGFVACVLLAWNLLRRRRPAR